MRHVPRVYVPQPLAENALLRVEDDAAHHLLNVLRVRNGDPLVLFNGEGGEYPATIVQLGKRALDVRVSARREGVPESPLRFTLAQALTRAERMDYAVQKATELGVSVIQPVVTEFSLHLEADRGERKLAHWRAVAQSAAEQCWRTKLPVVAAPMHLSDWLARCDSELKLVLHPGGVTLRQLIPAKSIGLVIGPEGGLGESDLRACAVAGFKAVGLGPRLLRTETAGPVTIAALQTLWGDLGGDLA